MSDRGLTHLDPLGRARMVDVTPKDATHRRALARCKVLMKPETTNLIASNAITKGDVLAGGPGGGHPGAQGPPQPLPPGPPPLLRLGVLGLPIRRHDREGA